MNDNARLMVRFQPAHFGKPVEVWLNIDPYEAKSWNPLPRDRELFSDGIMSLAFSDAQRRGATKQLMDRKKLADYLAPLVASALADAITKQDTVNGYEQESP